MTDKPKPAKPVATGKNAEYCKAYRDRQAAEALKFEVLPVEINASKGVRERFTAMMKANKMGADELFQMLVLAGNLNLPPVLQPNDKVFRHLEFNNMKEANRDDNNED